MGTRFNLTSKEQIGWAWGIPGCIIPLAKCESRHTQSNMSPRTARYANLPRISPQLLSDLYSCFLFYTILYLLCGLFFIPRPLQ